MIPHSYFLSPVGPADHNDPHDITHAKMLMNRLGVLSRPKDGFSSKYDTALDDAVRTFQERSGLKQDATLMPRGPTEEAARREIGRQAFRAVAPVDGVGDEGANLATDIEQKGENLSRLGLLDPEAVSPAAKGERKARAEMQIALRAFQLGNGLKPDGVVQPGGPTAAAMIRAASGEDLAPDWKTAQAAPSARQAGRKPPASAPQSPSLPAATPQTPAAQKPPAIPMPHFRLQNIGLRGNNWRTQGA